MSDPTNGFKKLLLFTVLVAVLAAFGAVAAQAGSPKVEVCHVPPGNPDNYHTIRISSNALEAHLAHGDLAGSCNALCAELCDDGDACTVDDTGDCEEQGCPVLREPSNCDDGLSCTTDSCNSASGCVNEPVVCTPSDPSNLCLIPACDEMTGGCTETSVVCDSGQECNPDTGSCESSGPVCPFTTNASWEDCFAGVTVTSCVLREPNMFFDYDFTVDIFTDGGNGVFQSQVFTFGGSYSGTRQCPGEGPNAACIDGCPPEFQAVCEQEFDDWRATQPNCNP